MTIERHTTVADVLLGSGDHASALADLVGPQHLGATALSGAGALKSGTRDLVEREINSAAAGLLEIDLGDVLLGGWVRYRALRDAAVRTRDRGCETVELVRHRVTATHRPWVELRAGEVMIGRVDFEITTTLQIDGAVAVVEKAELRRMQFGECTATVAFTVLPQRPLGERRRKLPAWRVFELRNPIPLLGSSRRGTVPVL